MKDVKVGARNSAADMALIQAIHDAICQLGAACGQDAEDEAEDAADGGVDEAAEGECGPEFGMVTTPPFKNGGFLGLRLVQPPALTPQRSVQPHSAHDARYSKRRFRPCLGLVRTQDTDAHAH